jgi:hypothetical protein
MSNIGKREAGDAQGDGSLWPVLSAAGEWIGEITSQVEQNNWTGPYTVSAYSVEVNDSQADFWTNDYPSARSALAAAKAFARSH